MVRCPERRNLERFPVTNMKAVISVRYRFGTHQGDVVDFNRLGMSVVLRRPLPINKPLFISLKYSGSRLDGVVGAGRYRRRWRVSRGRFVAALLLLLVLPVATIVPALAALALVTAVWLALHTYELVLWREARAESRSVLTS